MKCLFFIAVVLLAGCSDFGSEPPRVMPGVSIDGIRLGDNRETVERQLGTIDGFGFGDGYGGKSWYVAEFVTGVHAGVRVYFIDIVYFGQPTSPGVVDMVSVRAPYSERTSRGIGIGSSFNDVRAAYGQPDKIWRHEDQTVIEDSYCFSKQTFSFLYGSSDSVVAMTLGILYPTPIDFVCR